MPLHSRAGEGRSGLPDPEELRKRAQGIELLLLDVDGVLTDGTLYYGESGEALKAFNAKDGQGIRNAQHAGLRVGVLSGRKSVPIERRAAELDLQPVILGSGDKGKDLDRVLSELRIRDEQVAYIGDDTGDLPVIERAGLTFAPRDAVLDVRTQVHYVLRARGGCGAVREAIDLLLLWR